VFLRQPTKTLGTPPFFSKAAFTMSFSHKISPKMKAIYTAAHFFALLVMVGASPIQEPITSPKQLESIGAKIEVDEYEDGRISIQVNWKPHGEINNTFPPRLDLIVISDDPADQPIGSKWRLHVRFSQVVHGVLTADFTLAPSELGKAQLWFRESQQVNYCFDLKDQVRGFPGAELDPFTDKKRGEQAGTGQPATRSQSESEGGDKPQPEAEERSR
jgi:hypothetical protein